ncbi:MAG TPA: hypothetical protein VG126_18635 [Thermoleophilaceae bacterium]|nr:hypothetical protein [Thermoleophilaceae bacterium]
MASHSELERALADAGGADAPREWAARLRALMRAELERGVREMEEARSGRERPVALAVAPAPNQVVVVALPLTPELRADADAVPERGATLAAAAVAALVEAAEPGPLGSGDDLALLLGASDGFLALAYPAADPRWSAEYAREALDDAVASIDRLRAAAHLLPGHALAVEDLRTPIGATHPLRVAEAVTRLGGSPLDEDDVERLEPELLRLLEQTGSVTRAHDDPDPRRRAMRRILQRLDGMGKWGGYHTAFDHLARGFAGNDRALAFEVGEELLAAGLLSEKPSVGQRHVSLNPRRAGEIRRLIDEGALPRGLSRG